MGASYSNHWEMGDVCKILVGKPKEGLDTDGRIIGKRIFGD